MSSDAPWRFTPSDADRRVCYHCGSRRDRHLLDGLCRVRDVAILRDILTARKPMMNKNDRWTEEDEKQLRAMVERKRETHDRQSEALMAVIKQHVPIRSGSVSDVSIYDLRKAMVAQGGAFRDALEPFDHMGRPQAVKDVAPSGIVSAMQVEREKVERAYEEGHVIEFVAEDDPLGGWSNAVSSIRDQGFMWDTFDYRVKVPKT